MMRKSGYNNKEREREQNRTAFEVGFCLDETFVIATSSPVGTL